jgi:hypothetical protein
MGRRVPRLAVAVSVVGILLCAGVARGHIVYGRPTLLSLVAGAERVALVRVVDPEALVVLEETGDHRPVVVVELREVLKGEGKPGEALRFVSHGHGVAEYRAGEEALVFLAPLERSRELDSLQTAGLRWVSFQEHDTRYGVDDENRARLLGAVRAYVAVEALPQPAARVAALRAVTLDLLTSGDPRLAAGAVQDLALARELPLVTPEDVPRLLEGVVSSSAAPIGLRVAVLSELGGRRLVEATPLWLGLLRTTPKPDRLQVIRAAGRHPSPEIDLELVGLLAGDDPELAAAAALALGDPVHAAATPSLGGALARTEPSVRMAAIRALSAIGTPSAREVLAAAADSHADPATRRRAAAAVRSLDP